METKTVKIEDILENGVYCPLPLEIIPNYMGINLVSVDSITYTEKYDGQLVNLTINFKPEDLDYKKINDIIDAHGNDKESKLDKVTLITCKTIVNGVKNGEI